jgi:hypothetical protein
MAARFASASTGSPPRPLLTTLRSQSPTRTLPRCAVSRLRPSRFTCQMAPPPTRSAGCWPCSAHADPPLVGAHLHSAGPDQPPPVRFPDRGPCPGPGINPTAEPPPRLPEAPEARIKELFFDRSGFCQLCQRLERGPFEAPSIGTDGALKRELKPSELALILDGRRVGRTPALLRRTATYGSRL